jgi:hypothetical protein
MAPPLPIPPSKRLKQQSITRYEKGAEELDKAAHEAQVDCFLIDRLPLRFADSPHLHRWLKAHSQGSGELLSRKRVAVLAHGRVQQVMQRVLTVLRSSMAITVGIDGWTNNNHVKVVNVVAVGRGVAYYWDSVLLRERSTAQAQHQPVLEKLESLIGKGVRVVALVTDNESVNSALFRRLKVDLPWLLHIPCAAHTIQLCVNKVMKLPLISGVVEGLLAMLMTFKRNKELRIGMKSQQSLLRIGQPPLQLINVVPTRWNSILFAAERILLLESCIRPYVDLIISIQSKDGGVSFIYDTVSFWCPLQTLIQFLLPYRIATDVVQSDKACLADVHHHFSVLINKASAISIPHPWAPLRGQVRTIIRSQWNNHVNINAVILCALFNFDSSYSSFPSELRGSANDWFFHWGPLFIQQWGLSDVDDEGMMKGELFTQFSEFMQKGGRFSTIEERRTLMMRVATAGGVDCDTRNVWGLYVETARELSSCAVALLNITASEAAVERSFSMQGLIHSKLRNRLSDNSVHMQMAFSFNTRALDNPPNARTRAAADSQEIPDHYVDDGEMGTSLLSGYQADEDIVAGSESESDSSDTDESKEEEKSEIEERRSEGDREDSQEEVLATDEELEEKYDGEVVQQGPSEADLTSQFIEDYVRKNRVSAGYRFTAVRQQVLCAALLNSTIGHTVDTMIKMIKDHVAPPISSSS